MPDSWHPRPKWYICHNWWTYVDTSSPIVHRIHQSTLVSITLSLKMSVFLSSEFYSKSSDICLYVFICLYVYYINICNICLAYGKLIWLRWDRVWALLNQPKLLYLSSSFLLHFDTSALMVARRVDIRWLWGTMQILLLKSCGDGYLNYHLDTK